EGRLTHNLVKDSAISINVIGWHAGWHFQGTEQLILHTDQQIVADEAGGRLTGFTTSDLTGKGTRESKKESRRTTPPLRVLGESHGVIEPDPSRPEATRQYLIDTITQMSAEYALGFADDRTTSGELSYYVGFAQQFGIVDGSIQPAALTALLPLQGADNFGPI